MACVITTPAGKAVTLQIDPVNVIVETRLNTAPWHSLRGGTYNPVTGVEPERVTLRMEAPAKRGSFPATFTVDSNKRDGWKLDRWVDPQDFIHALQDSLGQVKDRGRLWVNYPEADLYNWYIMVSLEEDHSGGYGDLPIVLTLELDRRIPLLTLADQQSGTPTSDTAPPPLTTHVNDTPTGASDGIPRPGKLYTTKDGDTLKSIAYMAYGDDSRYTDIFDANPALVSDDPTAVIAGVTLRLPP